MHRLLAALLLVAALLCAGVWGLSYVGETNDDVVYVALARALAQGKGYVELCDVRVPPHGKYPPGFPALLAPLQALAPDQLLPLRLVPAASGLLALVLAWVLLAERPLAIRAGAVGLTALNTFWAYTSGQVMSDLPFTAALLAFLVLLRGADRSPWRALAAGAALAGAFYLRTVTLALVPAAVLALAWQGRPARTWLLLAGTFALLAVPYLATMPGEADMSYRADMEGHPGWAQVPSNLAFYLRMVPLTLLGEPFRPFALAQASPALGALAWAVSLALLGLVGYGLDRVERGAGLACVAAYAAVFAAWPFQTPRFFLPLLPLLYAALLEGAWRVGGRRGQAALLVLVLAAELSNAGWAVSQATRHPNGPPRAAMAFLQDRGKPGEAVASARMEAWLYAGLPVLPSEPGFSLRQTPRWIGQMYRHDVPWVLHSWLAPPDQDPVIRLLESRPERFQRVFVSPEEGRSVYRLVGDGERFLRALELFEAGTAAAVEGRGDEAEEQLLRALEVDPAFPEARHNLEILRASRRQGAGTPPPGAGRSGGRGASRAMTRLLPLLALALLLAASPALGDDSPLFTLGPVTAKQVADWAVQVNLPAALAKPANFAPDVPIPVSRLQFVAPMPVPGWLNEGDLLGSGYAVDLDGSDILDSMTVREQDGVLRLDQVAVEPMGRVLWGPQQPFKADGGQKVYLLDPDSPYFSVLFHDPPTLGLQLQMRGYIPTVRRLPNPTLEVVVFEFCEGPSGPDDGVDEPSFTLDFGPGAQPDQHELWAWEPWACQRLGQPPQWLCARVAYLPMPTTPGRMDPVFTVNPTSQSDQLFLLTRVSYSLDPGVRLQTDAVVGRLWNGPAGRGTK